MSIKGSDGKLLSFARSDQIEIVELEGLVVMKIIKHAQENYPSNVAGQLLGMDVESTHLEITNSYPFPPLSSSSSEQNDAFGNEEFALDHYVQIDHLQYQLDMMHCVREVNIDHQVVGWYQSTGSKVSSFLTPQWLETQASYQSNLNAVVCLIYDPVRTVEGSLNLRAFRIGSKFMNLYENSSFDSFSFAKFDVNSIEEIIEEVPIRIRNVSLINAMVSTLEISDEMTGVNDLCTIRLDDVKLPILEQSLDSVLNELDEVTRDQSRYTFFVRNFMKVHGAQLDAILKKKKNKAKNASSSRDWEKSETVALNAMFANEPQRLETKLILRDLESYLDTINKLSQSDLLRTRAVEAIQSTDL
uniref:MPN domain-containing protein n=1 Tax=Timspurckia oligopyrenoides TaxID=708627 RepID=A0A7S0ZE47_9RHOD|mmetsp:Transcript_1768/g.3163  ORF Transcript_1768/g.3163 Transcript_1768/m.3163 type:complete len:359 (+) Transcript_1768:97-1173(+)